MPTTAMVIAAAWIALCVGLVVHRVRRRVRRLATGDKPSGENPYLGGLVLLLVGAAFWVVFGQGIAAKYRHDELIATGKPATATVTAVQETGNVINSRPQVRVVMNVEPESQPAFQSQETWLFSVMDMQTYTVGTRLKVFYDPADPDSVAVAGVIQAEAAPAAAPPGT